MKPNSVRCASSTRQCGAEALHQAGPVELLGVGLQQVGDVGAVVALALHDEGLGQQAVLDVGHEHRHAQHVGLGVVAEPAAVHRRRPLPS
jgi:hypothetical protein